MAQVRLFLMADVISDKQRDLNRALHVGDQAFGSRADAGGLTGRLPKAIQRIHEAGYCQSVLDYGTGKGSLVKRLRMELPDAIKVHGYDPAVFDFQTKPKESSDILTCLDVLEHVDIDTVDTVLEDIHELTSRFCFLIIDLQPSVRTLSDGRNAHILLAPHDWWLCRISRLFSSVTSFVIYHKAGFPQKLIVVASKKAMYAPVVYTFLFKLNIFEVTMTGGRVNPLS